jgi:hypothetical protein
MIEKGRYCALKKKSEIAIRSSAAEYLTYVAATGDNEQSFEMRYEDENIWLTQRMMATLYGVEAHTVNEHIKKVFADSELDEAATIRNFRIVQTVGSRQVTREVNPYCSASRELGSQPGSQPVKNAKSRLRLSDVFLENSKNCFC